MRITIFIFFLSALAFVFGCNKKNSDPNCGIRQATGDIVVIAGPDSMQVGESQALTLGVVAPELCVTDIKVNLQRIDDTLYYIEPIVSYSSTKEFGCWCTVEAQHYVRIYFSSPIAGNVSITAGAGLGNGAIHRIKVY